MSILHKLSKVDNLRRITDLGMNAFIHEDHRWLLPLLAYQQSTGQVTKPITLVMFDAHHDACDPNDIDAVTAHQPSSVTPDQVFDVCQDSLSKNDDDWVKAGMQLGLIKDAIIFGVTYHAPTVNPEVYKDSQGGDHLIWVSTSLPSSQLEYQGGLSDHVKYETHQVLWDALDWKRQNGVFNFADDAAPILLDLDLDCFSTRSNNVTFAWPDKIYEAEFETVSEYSSTRRFRD